MPTERFVVLGLAGVRATWFADVARWATAATIPVDFVKVVSREEARARLASGRPFSALLVDAGLGALDRDLVDLAADRGCAVVAADDGRSGRSWERARRRRGPADPGSVPTTCSTRSGRRPTPRRATRPRSPTRRAAHRVGERSRAPRGGHRLGRGRPVDAGRRPGRPASPPTPATGGSSCWPTWRSTPTRRCSTTPATWCPGVLELVEAHRDGGAAAPRGASLVLLGRRSRLRPAARAAPPPRLDRAAPPRGRRRARRAAAAPTGSWSPTSTPTSRASSSAVRPTSRTATSSPARRSPRRTWSSSWGCRGSPGSTRSCGSSPTCSTTGSRPSRIVPVVNRAPRSPSQRAELAAGARSPAGRHGARCGRGFDPGVRARAASARRGRSATQRHCRPRSCRRRDRRGPGPPRPGSPCAPGPSRPSPEPVLVAPGSLGSWADSTAGLSSPVSGTVATTT